MENNIVHTVRRSKQVTLCERCGSVQIVSSPPTPLDKLLTVLFSIRPFLCRRCGWRARRGWTDADLERLHTYGAGGSQIDASLRPLDDFDSKKTNQSWRTGTTGSLESDREHSEEFDIAAALGNEPEPARSPLKKTRGGFRTTRNPRRRRRHDLLQVIIVMTLAMIAMGLAWLFR
jgi:hypothetical protein